jgi:V/A-type H+-transporting ATPase subunit C
MNPNMAFYAVNTKIAAKKGRILKKEDWNKYIESTSVEKLTEIFKSNVEINKAFRESGISSVNRDSVEIALNKLKTVEIEELLHYFSGEYKEFIRTMLMEEEISDLSLVIRKLSREESLNEVSERFVHSKLFTTVDFDDLLTSKDVDQLIDKLKKTPYYNVLRNLTGEHALKREFHMEMKLHVVLYNKIYEAAKKLDKVDFNAVKEIVGLKIDLLNLQWIYRAIKYYNILPEEIFNYSLEGGKNIDLKKIRKLCYSKSIKEFKRLARGFLDYDIFQDLNAEKTGDTEIDINTAALSYMFNYLKDKRYYNIGAAISFIYLLDVVINDLTSITEGIKYHVPKEKLEEYLAYRV